MPILERYQASIINLTNDDIITLSEAGGANSEESPPNTLDSIHVKKSLVEIAKMMQKIVNLSCISHQNDMKVRSNAYNCNLLISRLLSLDSHLYVILI